MNGSFPYTEIDDNKRKNGEKKYDAQYFQLRHNNKMFWKLSSYVSKRPEVIDQDFINFMNPILAENPEERPSITEILEHPYMKKNLMNDPTQYNREMAQYLASK
mmetsp:Transcript_95913/g.133175  ORF Transcript_95913/g.133175 Transcript_95913/m.133175 type:complete len:104 (+) Transcript_95913:484-795(+)